MDEFLTLAVSGAVTGAIYSLIASGLTLSYAATGIFNFSYAAVAFASAYLFYEFNTGLHWPVAVAAIVVIGVFAPLLGMFLDVAVFRPLARATDSAKIMATVGLLLAIPALTEWIIDGLIEIFHLGLPPSSTVLQVSFPSGLGPIPQLTWHLPGGIPITSNGLIVLISAALSALGLWFLLRMTQLGLQMRAVVDRHSLARIRGINDNKTSRYAWVVGTMLAALAGVVGSPIIGAINTNSYLTVTLVASAAAVIGRLRSIPIAFIGGLLLGVVQNLVAGYVKVSISGFTDSVPFFILFVALVLLARDRSRRGGSTADDVPPPTYLSLLPRWRQALPWVLATGFLVVYILFLANDFWAGLMAQGLALGIVFLSFVVVTGMGGMVSLAQATFCTVAGLTTGLFFQQYHLPFLVAVALALLVTIIIGMLVALPAIRLGGLFLALATLALGLLGDNLLFQWGYLNNNQSGWTIPRLVIGPLDFTDNRTMALSLLVLVGVVMLLIHNLKKSPWGRSIAAVRSSEFAASTSGIEPVRVKLVLFGFSAFLAGLGGIFYAMFQTSADPMNTPTTVGLTWLAAVVLFGIRRPAAAVLAGLSVSASNVILQSGFHWWSWVPSWLSWNGTNSTEIPLIFFGLGAIGLSRDPDGFLTSMAAQNHARRLRSQARKAGRAMPAFDPVAPVPQVTISAIEEEDELILAEVEQHREQLERLVIAPHDSAPGLEPVGVLSLRGLEVGYGEVEVLHGIDLSVPQGQITALFGVNGSGKTTLCSTVAGLVTPKSGSIILDGEDIVTLPAYRRVDRGILLAPESRGIFPGLSVEENMALRLDSDHRDEVYRRFPVLQDRRRIPAGNLSGGEQQMLALAPILVSPPKVVIVDEPTLGLAPLVVGQVLDIFREMRDLGTTILLVEEKIRDVLTVADHVAFIELGHILWSGERAELDDQQLVGAYLGATL